MLKPDFDHLYIQYFLTLKYTIHERVSTIMFGNLPCYFKT